MTIEVTKKDNESFLSMLRRFNRRLKASGVLRKARARRFKASKPTRRQKRLSALHREEMKEHFEKLRKLGKPTEISTRHR